MKASELRIDNIIYISKEKQEATIFSINKIIGVQVNNNILSHLTFDEIEPILITEKRLIKYGFVMSYNGHKAEHGSFCLSKALNGWALFWQHGDKQIGLDRKIKYIHELQNLFVSLTNYEL